MNPTRDISGYQRSLLQGDVLNVTGTPNEVKCFRLKLLKYHSFFRSFILYPLSANSLFLSDNVFRNMHFFELYLSYKMSVIFYGNQISMI